MGPGTRTATGCQGWVIHYPSRALSLASLTRHSWKHSDLEQNSPRVTALRSTCTDATHPHSEYPLLIFMGKVGLHFPSFLQIIDKIFIIGEEAVNIILEISARIKPIKES